MLATYRQRDHPLQHAAAISGIRAQLAANDQNAIEILKGISPVAWRNVNLIGNFDFTTGTSPVDIEALAERYENPDFLASLSAGSRR